MRRFLFRGKDTEFGKWHYGYLKQGKNTCIGTWIVDEKTNERIAPLEVIVDPKTVGQYTEVNDINKEEIFEGDIIFFNNGKSIGKVVWTFGQYYIDCEDYEEEYDGIDESCSLIEILKNGSADTIDGKIIGNIYDGINK